MTKPFVFFAIFCFMMLTNCKLLAQQWMKKYTKSADSIYAIYAWEANDKYHSAFGQITLKKSGRYKYFSRRPLDYQEYSDGTYKIANNKLILTSDLQQDNVRVEISYVDSTSTDTAFNRLYYPKNNRGEYVICYYLFNHDTAGKTIYAPGLTQKKELPPTITSIKLGFWDADFGSVWIPVLQNNQFIVVKILTDENYFDYKPRVFKAWTFKISKDRLTEIAKE